MHTEKINNSNNCNIKYLDRLHDRLGLQEHEIFLAKY